jgi:hypothetical protein
MSAGDLTISQQDGPSSLTLELALFAGQEQLMLVMQNDWMQLVMMIMMTADGK